MSAAPDREEEPLLDEMDVQAQCTAWTFRKPFREYLRLREADYRFRVVAPDVMRHLEEAEAGNWSDDKLATFIDGPPGETLELRRSYRQARRIFSAEGPAERMQASFCEWLARFEGLDSEERKSLARELSSLVADRLHALGVEGKANQLALALGALAHPAPIERPSLEEMAKRESEEDGPPRWGPQWKDDPGF